MKTKMMFLVACAFMITSSLTAQNYIGAAKCKMCHNKAAKGSQYDKWAAGPHANALNSLKDAEKKDPKCLKCHSTAASVDKALIATLTAEEGVSCESCHGPGSKYKSMSTMKSRDLSVAAGLIVPTEETCKKCHNDESPNFKGFNYEEYLKKIAHPNPAK